MAGKVGGGGFSAGALLAIAVGVVAGQMIGRMIGVNTLLAKVV